MGFFSWIKRKWKTTVIIAAIIASLASSYKLLKNYEQSVFDTKAKATIVQLENSMETFEKKLQKASAMAQEAEHKLEKADKLLPKRIRALLKKWEPVGTPEQILRHWNSIGSALPTTPFVDYHGDHTFPNKQEIKIITSIERSKYLQALQLIEEAKKLVVDAFEITNSASEDFYSFKSEILHKDPRLRKVKGIKSTDIASNYLKKFRGNKVDWTYRLVLRKELYSKFLQISKSPYRKPGYR